MKSTLGLTGDQQRNGAHRSRRILWLPSQSSEHEPLPAALDTPAMWWASCCVAALLATAVATGDLHSSIPHRSSYTMPQALLSKDQVVQVRAHRQVMSAGARTYYWVIPGDGGTTRHLVGYVVGFLYRVS